MAKISESKLRTMLRDRLMSEFLEYAQEQYGTALVVKGNKIAIGVVDDNGDDRWAELTIAIPTGSHDGSEQYDGEMLAKDYADHCAEKQAEAEERERKRQADAKIRAEKAAEKKRLKELEQAKKAETVKA